jgi:hypothetical protein
MEETGVPLLSQFRGLICSVTERCLLDLMIPPPPFQTMLP